MKEKDALDLSEAFVNEALKRLKPGDLGLLYKAPVLVSVLAASSYNRINEDQKAEALKLAHLKTFTARAELLSFYKVVEVNFKSDFEQIEKQFYPFAKPDRAALKNEIERVNVILSKLEPKVAGILHKSLNDYATHIKRSGIGILDDFIFPLPIKGLTF